MAKRNLFGLIYDDKTGKVTYDDGEVPNIGGDFTFENHDGVNPLQYATDKTGAKLVEILSGAFPSIAFSTERDEVKGPLSTPPSLQIKAESHGIFERFNAGLIANSLIRSGSLSSFRQNLKTAGLLF